MHWKISSERPRHKARTVDRQGSAAAPLPPLRPPCISCPMDFAEGLPCMYTGPWHMQVGVHRPFPEDLGSFCNQTELSVRARRLPLPWLSDAFHGTELSNEKHPSRMVEWLVKATSSTMHPRTGKQSLQALEDVKVTLSGVGAGPCPGPQARDRTISLRAWTTLTFPSGNNLGTREWKLTPLTAPNTFASTDRHTWLIQCIWRKGIVQIRKPIVQV